MSIRRETTTLSLGPKQAAATPTGVTAAGPLTISERLGIQTSAPPKQWPGVKPFRPQFKEVPFVSETVVDDVFDEMGIYVDPTGGFLNALKSGAGSVAKGARAAAEGAGKLAGKAAEKASVAKTKADAVVRKAAAGKKAMAASITNKLAGLKKFDYKIYDSEDMTAILAVARKAADGQGDEKNNIAPFKGYTHDKITKTAQNQEGQMLHKESLTKKVKGKTKDASQAVAGRNAMVLGYSKIDDEASEESKNAFGDALFDEAAPAGVGVPTIVQLDPEVDINKVDNMFPMTALVIEALDTDDLATSGEVVNGKKMIKLQMQAVPQAKIAQEVVTNLTQDQVEFQYTLCVHGLYVNAEKELVKGRKILVPQRSPADVASYGIATANGIESALHHAMEGTEIDLLYLWACYRLVQGVHSLGSTNLNGENKKAVGKLLGEALGKAKGFDFAEDVDEDEFDELNRTFFRIE